MNIPEWIEVGRLWDGDMVDGEWVDGCDDATQRAILAPGVQVVLIDQDGDQETILIGDLGPYNGCEGCKTDFYGCTIVRYRRWEFAETPPPNRSAP